MNKKICAGLLLGLAAAAAQAAPGEYWEVTTKMEMVGMPFPMPAVSMKLCVPKGGEKNPQHMQKKDSDCKMSDVRTSGNKVTWKASCVHDSETLNGSGESYYEGDSYRGTLHLTGNSNGHELDMTQTYNGRRVGGSCDSDAQIKELTGGNEATARRESAARSNRQRARDYANRPDGDDEAPAGDADSENGAGNSMLESAKKLKGVFGF